MVLRLTINNKKKKLKKIQLAKKNIGAYDNVRALPKQENVVSFFYLNFEHLYKVK